MVIQKKTIQRGLLVIAAILVLIQFIRPARNESAEYSKDITKKFPVPDSVLTILKPACYDCHSNHTDYPWYANIQPVAWWLADHVNEGKKELNFSEFASYRPFRQYNKLDKIVKELDESEMPLYSYTIMHGNARLSNEQRLIVSHWAADLRDKMKATYPADSLARPKKIKS
jgi:hypothetical protein